MYISIALSITLIWMYDMADNRPTAEIVRSGKHGNISVVFLTSSRQPPGGKTNPSLRLILDEKGRLVPSDGGLFEIKDLKSIVLPLFRKGKIADLLVVIKDPSATSLTKCVALIDRISEIIDEKHVLTLYIHVEEK